MKVSLMETLSQSEEPQSGIFEICYKFRRVWLYIVLIRYNATRYESRLGLLNISVFSRYSVTVSPETSFCMHRTIQL
jgi:hypothetical protein